MRYEEISKTIKSIQMEFINVKNCWKWHNKIGAAMFFVVQLNSILELKKFYFFGSHSG